MASATDSVETMVPKARLEEAWEQAEHMRQKASLALAQCDALLLIVGLLRVTHTGMEPEEGLPGTVADQVYTLVAETSRIDLKKLPGPVFNELKSVTVYALSVAKQHATTDHGGLVGHA